MKFLTGSRYFFDSMPGFIPKDSDYLQLVPYQKEMYISQINTPVGQDTFSWRANETASAYIDYTLARNDPYLVGSFIQADFARAIGAKIADLKRLLPLTEKLDKKHTYVGRILKFYIRNGGFFLTDEQRSDAYLDYQHGRMESPLFSTKKLIQDINNTQRIKRNHSMIGSDG